MSFTIFYNEKTPFYGIIKKSSKSRKIDISQKGLTHGFGPKMATFSTFFLSNIGQEKVFYVILERKNAFLICKNKKFKKSKNWDFCKGDNPLGLSRFPCWNPKKVLAKMAKKCSKSQNSAQKVLKVVNSYL